MELLLFALTAMKTVFGIGLIIFVHELGHYIAARMCGVRVETFSLGFGPRLFGWKRGETMYQIAAVPLGGYCRMAGEEFRESGREPAPDELPAKPVGQRFFIYSGGVLMNVVFALVMFPIIFWIGVPFTRPTIRVIEGGPAWKANVPSQAEVLAINGNEIHEFEAILTEIALSPRGPVTLTIRERGQSEPRQIDVLPEREESGGFRHLGVRADCERDESGHPVLHVEEDSPAAKAGIGNGARLLGVVGAASHQSPREQLAIRSTLSEPAQLRILDENGERTVTVTPEPIETEALLIGIAPSRNIVEYVRASEDTRQLGIEGEDQLVRVSERAIFRTNDLLEALLAAEGEIRFEYRRAGHLEETTLSPLPLERRIALARDIGLKYDWDHIAPQPGAPAALAGMLDGDRILRIDGSPTLNWEDIQKLVRKAGKEDRPAQVEVERQGADGVVSASFSVKPRTPYGFGVRERSDIYTYKAAGAMEAVRVGLRSCWRMIDQTYLTLQRMLFNDVSPKNVGGILTIGAVSYHMASLGWIKHIFFLCLLSINLAVINLLPIPVLDGGHLAFLIVEKIKGTPVSRKTLEYSQMIGVVLLLTLMVYVTYNDLMRWVFDKI